MRTFTGSTNCDDRGKKGNSKGKIMVNLLENIRDPDEINRLNEQCIQYGKPPKYDLEKAQMNIVYEACRTEEEAFLSVFGEAMERYNDSQKRNDRKTSLEKEMEKLAKGKVKQELVHCMITQVGDKEHHPPVDECVEILTEYYIKFKEKFPNMKIINAAIHLDEDTPHLQIYFIPVKTKEQHEALGSNKKWSGMDVQPSLTGALEQMGYSNDATITTEDGKILHDYKNGAMAQWQKDFNGLLDEICMEHDIAINHYMRGKKVSHQDTIDYYDGKIHKEIAKAKNDRDGVENALTNALLEVENAREERQKLQAENNAIRSENGTLKEQNEALRTNNKIIEDEKNAAIKERDAAKEEVKNLKAAIGIMKNELMEWAGKLQNEIVAIFKKLNNARRIASNSPWLSETDRGKIYDKADEIAERSEKTVEKPMSDARDYANAYDKLGKELRKAGDLEQVARRKKNIEDIEDGWEYDD